MRKAFQKGGRHSAENAFVYPTPAEGFNCSSREAYVRPQSNHTGRGVAGSGIQWTRSGVAERRTRRLAAQLADFLERKTGDFPEFPLNAQHATQRGVGNARTTHA